MSLICLSSVMMAKSLVAPSTRESHQNWRLASNWPGLRAVTTHDLALVPNMIWTKMPLLGRRSTTPAKLVLVINNVFVMVRKSFFNYFFLNLTFLFFDFQNNFSSFFLSLKLFLQPSDLF